MPRVGEELQSGESTVTAAEQCATMDGVSRSHGRWRGMTCPDIGAQPPPLSMASLLIEEESEEDCRRSEVWLMGAEKRPR